MTPVLVLFFRGKPRKKGLVDGYFQSPESKKQCIFLNLKREDQNSGERFDFWPSQEEKVGLI